MTSKEALEKFKLLYESKCKSSNNIIGFDMCYTTIKQDLERLEELEEENQDLKDNEKIITDYGYNLVIENEKYKKAIEILKMQTSIENIKCENGNIYIVDIGDISLLITQQEYELLKEVLENEK